MLDAGHSTGKPVARHASWLGRAALVVLLLLSYLAAAVSALGLVLPGAVPAVLAVGLVGTLALGVFWPRAGVFARPLLSGASGLSRPGIADASGIADNLACVALTFDDGPDPVTTPLILDLLDRHQAQATFFVIGDRARRHPALLADMVRRGHQVENHSQHHAWTTPLLSPTRLAGELREAQEVIFAACGRRPRFFRPPVGLLSPPLVEAARRTGLMLCAWSCNARDGMAGTTVAAALSRLAKGLRPGAILVLHDAAERGDRVPIAPAVLQRLLPQLTERGLRAVTLDRLLAGA